MSKLELNVPELEYEVEISGDGGNIGGVPCGVIVVAVALYASDAN